MAPHIRSTSGAVVTEPAHVGLLSCVCSFMLQQVPCVRAGVRTELALVPLLLGWSLAVRPVKRYDPSTYASRNKDNTRDRLRLICRQGRKYMSHHSPGKPSKKTGSFRLRHITVCLLVWKQAGKSRQQTGDLCTEKDSHLHNLRYQHTLFMTQLWSTQLRQEAMFFTQRVRGAAQS